MSVKTIKIHDTGTGLKSVKDDLEAVLKKIEGWHQGSIAGFLISYRDTDGVCTRFPGTAKNRLRKQLQRSLEE